MNYTQPDDDADFENIPQPKKKGCLFDFAMVILCVSATVWYYLVR